MFQDAVNYLVTTFQDTVPHELIVFLISMLTILELRGGMIVAYGLGMPLVPAFLICFLGNMLPIPFILLFIRKIFALLKKTKLFKKLVEKFELRAKRKSETVKKSRFWAVFLFVAIPLPGTGGWTGALVADFLDMRIRTSLLAITLGVFTAGVIMSLGVYGVWDQLAHLIGIA